MAHKFRIIKSAENLDVGKSLNDFEMLYRVLANGTYDVTIEKHIEKRTTLQNSLMWMWFQCVADSFNENAPEMKYTREDIYDYFTFKFLSGQNEINGETVITIQKTSQLKTDEMAKFLNTIQAHSASEFGIVLPTPDDLHYEQFYEQYKNYSK